MNQLPNDLNMQARGEMIKARGQRRQDAAADIDGATAAQLRRFRRVEMFKLLGFVFGLIVLLALALLILSLFIK